MILKKRYPKILVFGVGGGGSNSINNVMNSNIKNIDFLVANTDFQALELSNVKNKIKLGPSTTRGFGTGSNPELGKVATEESLKEISDFIKGYDILFITAGMGGGTGTGGLPVIAKFAKEKKILTIGVVTKPFFFEGLNKMQIAEKGLDNLEKLLDTLIVIPNQNLFRLTNEKTTFTNSFKIVDKVLCESINNINEIINGAGVMNLDFSDISSIIKDGGRTMIGTGESSGRYRSISATENAIINPLLDNSHVRGAKKALVNIQGGRNITLFEIDESVNRIKEEIGNEVKMIFGYSFNKNSDDKIKVSILATGIRPAKHKDSHFRSAYKTFDMPSILRKQKYNFYPV